MVLRTQSRQLSQVSPTMPAIRSMLICSKSKCRGPVVAPVDLRARRWARPLASRILSSKFSMPRLSRVTPISLSASSLCCCKRAGLALEGDLGGLVPGKKRLQPLDQAARAARAEVRRRAAAEVDEVQRPAADDRQLAVQLDFLDQGVEIDLDIAGVLVGVDAEVAELAALAAKRNVQVKPERRAGPRRRFQGRRGVGQMRRLPEPRTADSWQRSSCPGRFFLACRRAHRVILMNSLARATKILRQINETSASCLDGESALRMQLSPAQALARSILRHSLFAPRQYSHRPVPITRRPPPTAGEARMPLPSSMLCTLFPCRQVEDVKLAVQRADNTRDCRPRPASYPPCRRCANSSPAARSCGRGRGRVCRGCRR